MTWLADESCPTSLSSYETLLLDVEFLKQNPLPTWADQFSNVALHGGSLESPGLPGSENKSAVDSKVYLRIGGTNRRNRITFSNEDREYIISHV